MDIDDALISTLLTLAWDYRQHARVLGRTAVGAAVLGEDGNIHGGCNVQHSRRSGDMHAETVAIGTMVAEGCRRLKAVAVVAEFPGLTPCGSCLDWILEFGGDDCLIIWQGSPAGPINRKRANELLPHHPPYAQT